MLNSAQSSADGVIAPRWDIPPGLARLVLVGLFIGLLPGLALGMGVGLTITARSVPIQQPIAQQALPTVSTTAQGEQQPDVAVAETIKGALPYARQGPVDAPIKLIIFEDPRCGFCKQMANGTEKTLIEKYVSTGKVALYSRAFDVLGAESKQISIAAACAGSAGKYWQFREQFFGEQQAAMQSTAAQIVAWAQGAGITDMEGFKRCLTSDDASAAVEADNGAGNALGIRGTPTMFINGRRLVGAVPIDFIENAITEAMRDQAK